MCDFYKRLIAAVEKLDGVTCVRIEHGGAGSSARRFRRHPHLMVALINGKAFRYPLRGRPLDKCRGYFCSYLHAIRHNVRELRGR